MFLFNASDVKKIRDKILKEQEGNCAVTKTSVQKPCLDHDHESMLVRGVLSHGINTFVGHIENAYKRRVQWWCDMKLPELLRLVADYLDRKHPQDYYHPSWIKKAKTEFNKLNSSQKTKVLESFNSPVGTNDTQRKVNFKKLLTKKMNLGYDAILQAIEKSKEVV